MHVITIFIYHSMHMYSYIIMDLGNISTSDHGKTSKSSVHYNKNNTSEQ